jgi:bidirectional [NiFe] hydrogenase diaphorase subunit
MPAFPVTIDDKPCTSEQGETILSVCKRHDIHIPTMCHFDGLTDVGACRLCLVEIEGVPKLLPSCTTTAAPNQKIRTRTGKLDNYRRMITELLFAERNHVCAVCIANGNCELQDLGYAVGMDHVRYPYLYPPCDADASHQDFIQDDNRCILCTRCVRVCSEVEGAHTWDIMGRGIESRLISDYNQPWGESDTCTSCGKCVQVCPTGALWPKDANQGFLRKRPLLISELVAKRKVRT